MNDDTREQRHLLVVLSNATDGGDDEFNDWYTNTHLGDVTALPGFVAAQRFKLSGQQLGTDAIPYGYLAIYEVNEDDLPAAAEALTGPESSSMEISTALDRDRTVAWFYTPITGRVKANG